MPMKPLYSIQPLRARRGRVCVGPRALLKARGVSIVELMIGITIGLFILAGASLVMTSQISDNRRLLLDTQVQQDLRAVSSLIVRDVRRANYYGLAHRKIWPNDLTQSTANPYAGLLPATSDGSSSLQYERSLDDQSGPANNDNNAVSNSERVTIALNSTNHTVEMTLGPGTAVNIWRKSMSLGSTLGRHWLLSRPPLSSDKAQFTEASAASAAREER